MTNMRYTGYPNQEKIEKRHKCRKTIQTWPRNRFIMLLVYYNRLYITYTLASFLFDLDQSNICRDIQKNGPLIRKCIPAPQKIYRITKNLQTPEEVKKYFPRISCFYRYHYRTADTKIG
jgi:hypothetical protein